MTMTYVEIDLKAYYSNVKAILRHVHPAKVMAVIKSDAYGHGLIEIAKTAAHAGVDYLGVANPEEGIELRQAGIQLPILVFTVPLEHQVSLFAEYDLDLTLSSFDIAQEASKIGAAVGHPLKVHIKIDTGMGRLGFPYEETLNFLETINKFSGIEIVGLYSHLATSDEDDKGYAVKQIQRFNKTIETLERAGFHIPSKHLANSGAILDLPEANFDMVRAGIMSYGLYPSRYTSRGVAVQPVLSMRTKVVYIKTVPEDTSISYGRKYITSKPARIAAVPIGYADGFNRRLTDQGEVLIRGNRFPVIGTICMNLTMIDLQNDESIQTGDDVTIYGISGDESISVSEVAEKLETIPYEVCCWISQRIPRVYI